MSIFCKPAAVTAAVTALLLAGVPCPVSAGIMDAFTQLTGGIKPSVTLVLIDQSSSIKASDAELYLISLRAAGAALGPGDRILVSPIDANTRSDFRATYDATVPVIDKHLRQADAIEATRRDFAARATALMHPAGHPARLTRIREAVSAGALAFGQASARRAGSCRAIILSDAVESAPDLDLNRSPITEAGIVNALRASRDAALLPDLRGCDVFMIGAGGKYYAENERFWRKFFAATGGTLVSYGRLPFREFRSEGR